MGDGQEKTPGSGVAVSATEAGAAVEGDTTYYAVPELGTVATVRHDVLLHTVTLIWGPEEGMADSHQVVSADEAHDMARRHAARLA